MEQNKGPTSRTVGDEAVDVLEDDDRAWPHGVEPQGQRPVFGLTIMRETSRIWRYGT